MATSNVTDLGEFRKKRDLNFTPPPENPVEEVALFKCGVCEKTVFVITERLEARCISCNTFAFNLHIRFRPPTRTG